MLTLVVSLYLVAASICCLASSSGTEGCHWISLSRAFVSLRTQLNHWLHSTAFGDGDIGACCVTVFRYQFLEYDVLSSTVGEFVHIACWQVVFLLGFCSWWPVLGSHVAFLDTQSHKAIDPSSYTTSTFFTLKHTPRMRGSSQLTFDIVRYALCSHSGTLAPFGCRLQRTSICKLAHC